MSYTIESFLLSSFCRVLYQRSKGQIKFSVSLLHCVTVKHSHTNREIYLCGASGAGSGGGLPVFRNARHEPRQTVRWQWRGEWRVGSQKQATAQRPAPHLPFCGAVNIFNVNSRSYEQKTVDKLCTCLYFFVMKFRRNSALIPIKRKKNFESNHADRRKHAHRSLDLGCRAL